MLGRGIAHQRDNCILGSRNGSGLGQEKVQIGQGLGLAFLQLANSFLGTGNAAQDYLIVFLPVPQFFFLVFQISDGGGYFTGQGIFPGHYKTQAVFLSLNDA